MPDLPKSVRSPSVGFPLAPIALPSLQNYTVNMVNVQLLSGPLATIANILLLFPLAQAIPLTDNSARGPHAHYPTRSIAGVSVVDTPIVRAAQAYAKQYSQDFTFQHVMRSWLLGALVVKHNETLQATVDMEVHAVASLLHDLGWDQAENSPMISPDRRFEVDGAIAARDFIRSHRDGRTWEERRVQLVWDSIALHTDASIAAYKEIEVQLAQKAIHMDFETAEFGVTEEEFAAVTKAFPRTDFVNGVNETFIWLCQTKPASTYGQIH